MILRSRDSDRNDRDRQFLIVIFIYLYLFLSMKKILLIIHSRITFGVFILVYSCEGIFFVEFCIIRAGMIAEHRIITFTLF